MKVVCFGDSLTACGGAAGRFSDILQDRFPGHCFVNRGVGGETWVDGLARLRADVLDAMPDVVLVEFGANDWWRDERPPDAWGADLRACLRQIRGAGAVPVILGVFGPRLDAGGRRIPKTEAVDARADRYRLIEQDAAREFACPYIANIQERIIGNRCCWRDRNHPNEYGNRHVADTIEPVLADLLRTAPLAVRRPTLELIVDLWDEAVRLTPDAPAVVDGALRLTFAEADGRVRQLAAGLHRVAPTAQPRIAVFLPNCLDYFLIYWAVARLGGAIVPLNTWLRRDSLEAIFANIRPDVLISAGTAADEVLQAAAAFPELPVFIRPPGAVGAGRRSFADLTFAAPAPAVPRARPGDPAIIMHTSGTTAAPKGAVMCHADLMFNVMTTINAHQFATTDVHLLVNPMFHCTALYSSLTTAAYQKTPVVITADTTPDALLGLVEKERITTWLTVPSILQRVTALGNLDRWDLSSLRLIGYAGSQMPVSTIKQLQSRFPGVELHNFFGLTETISMTHVLSGEDAMERPDSIGRLLPFVDARIVDDNGAAVPPGTVGELLFARANVIPGYYNQPDKLSESIIEIEGRQWFNTGDLAAVDADGYFFIKGRKKDMIIVGGENVYALEVEGILMGCDKVREAAVKGVPATGVRESLGELIKAYIVPDDSSLTEMQVRRYCHQRLPSYKIPHLIVFLDALPRNPAGKVVKAELD